LPWLDKSPVKSIRYRGATYKIWLAVFVVCFFILGYLGTEVTTIWGTFDKSVPLVGGVDRATVIARICTVLYFGFFALMPFYTKNDKTKPVPERVTA
jgi:ubiquinol-cytochrome c reductase cytochrome b subunit